MNRPKITIVTVCYNAVKEIEKTILSVINQTYDNIEYIIVDGGSVDGTVEIIKKYDERVTKWVSESDRGIYDAMNKGIIMSSGDYINFMNAGDWFINTHVIEDILDYFSSENDVIYGDSVVEILGVKYLSKVNQHELENNDSVKMGFIHQSAFVKTDLAKQYKFDVNYKLAADFKMIVSIYRCGGNFIYCNNPVAFYDLVGVSSLNFRRHRYECLCIRNQDERIKNWISAYLFYLERKLRSMVRNVVTFVYPQFLTKRYDNMTGYERYNEVHE